MVYWYTHPKEKVFFLIGHKWTGVKLFLFDGNWWNEQSTNNFHVHATYYTLLLLMGSTPLESKSQKKRKKESVFYEHWPHRQQQRVRPENLWQGSCGAKEYSLSSSFNDVRMSLRYILTSKSS